MTDRRSLMPNMFIPEPRLGPIRRVLFKVAWPLIRWFTRLKQVDRSYAGGVARVGDGELEQGCLDAAGVTWSFSDAELARIPTEGPVVVVSNHPYGMADGLLQTMLLRRVRTDYRQLVNESLAVFPLLAERYITVSVMGDDSAKRENASPLRASLAWLKQGHALASFPSGTVSHRTRRCPEVVDPPWNPSIVMLAKRARATVVPMYFSGHNGRLFQWAGLISARLRTALIPRCYASMRGSCIRAAIGNPIPPETLAGIRDRGEAIRYLRERVYMLANRTASTVKSTPSPSPGTPVPTPSPDGEALAAEVASLPEDNHFFKSGDLTLHIARAADIPLILGEIGRLREVTFRAVGEGTGNDVDLDEYDQTYRHLFIWNNRDQEVVGAYRLGLSDEILAAQGIDGFYTRTLFDYDERMITRLGDVIELGRSFIRPEYQRGFKPLMLLWRGISNFSAQHRRYRHCFGVVTMSNEYSELSKALITRFLMRTEMADGYDALVSSRNPWTTTDSMQSRADDLLNACATIEDVDELVADIEPDQDGVPVLIRQYLKLNAKLLAPFNLDRTFGDCVDGLMLVDFMQVDRRIAHFYLGHALASAFRTHHGFDPFPKRGES
jgi:putative hemolysin